MKQFVRRLFPLVAVALGQLAVAGFALAAPVQLSAEQQQAVDKLKDKGGSVMQLAADNDSLVVNLGLAGKQAGDAELALVKGLPKVVELDVHGTAVTDAGLANVAGLKELTHLRLDRTQVTDAGLAHLKELSKLVYLNLYDTPVTDAGLEHLKGLKSLKRVYLWQSKVTDAGAEALRKALPEATVNRGEGMAALAAVAAAPATPPATAAEGKPINTTCPVSGKPVDPTKTVAFEGKTVGFCCDNCPKEFQKDPKKFVAKIPELNKPDPKPAVASAGDLKPDEEGFIRTWLLLAPIPASPDGAAEIDREQVSAEKDLKPKENDKAKAGDKELAWKVVKAGDFLFDVNSILGQDTDNSVAYAVAYIDAPAEKKDLQLLIGSDDQAKVYLNGKEVLKNTEGRGLAKDQDKATGLTLNKGTNVLVFKVANGSGGWQGAARFTDKDGKPVTDVKLKVQP